MIEEITSYLDTLFPNPRCELNYSKDYELLIAVMLSAQTTDKRVNQVTEVLFSKYNNIELLANALEDDVITIVRPLGNYTNKGKNVIAIARSIKDNYGGIIPNNREYLESLPGVGRKTTNVVLSNLYNENVIAVDTHVARVSKRLNLAKESDDVLIIEKKLNKKFKNNLGKIHHQLVLFGRYYCKAKSPLCSDCKLKSMCKIGKKID